MKDKIRKLIKRKRVDSPEYIQQAAADAPRITNHTVAEHREEVLSSARKYILPLAHSRKQIVTITTSLVVAGVVAFFTYTALALYRFQSNSLFIYRVTQVIPFPIAKAGNNFVSYENYLFELRRYVHYYETQQATDFSDPQSKGQLDAFKKQALEKVINDAYTKQLAEKQNISVSAQEVTEAVNLVRSQNRLGGSDTVFADVLKEYWGWSETDFRRSLKAELLSQKVVEALDTDTRARADTVLAALKSGQSFATVAKQYSDDITTKNNGGEYGYPIDQTTRNIPAKTAEALFALKAGEYSQIINNGEGLEVIKSIEINGVKVRAAHIILNFKDISSYINDLKSTSATRSYIQV